MHQANFSQLLIAHEWLVRLPGVRGGRGLEGVLSQEQLARCAAAGSRGGAGAWRAQ